MKRTIAITLLFLTQQLYSQSFIVFDVDTTNFPEMKAKFLAFDDENNQLTGLSVSDFEVWEDGVEREVLSVTCPEPTPPQAISSVLTIDISGSMSGKNLEMAKAATRAWVENLPDNNSECAITSFDNENYINQDFTTDKNKLMDAIDAIDIKGGTDFNAALLDPKAGALLVAEKGKNKKVIVLLTDGMGACSKTDIINKANAIGASIYCIILDYSCQYYLKEIAEQTGGKWYEKVSGMDEIIDIYKEILYYSTNRDACTISWDSGIKCTAGKTNVEIILKNPEFNNTFNYNPPENSIANLSFTPVSIYFKNKNPGQQYDTTITVSANNFDFQITDITSENPDFQITPSSFSLEDGESIQLTLSFTPSDSAYEYTISNIINDICPVNYFASGGFIGYKSQEKTLKLTHPNGGENFIIGSDTLITWEGISPIDTVVLEYSIDNGLNWNLITNEASGLEYIWTNIPKPPSEQCLVRIKQLGYGTGNDSVPAIEWQKCLGGSEIEIARAIIQSSDGNYVVAGSSASKDGDLEKNNGSSDFWIVKLDFLGNIIWEKNYGGSQYDAANSIRETKDGGYIVAGYTASYNIDVSDHKGGIDYWIIRLNSEGELLWEKTLGGSDDDLANDIILNIDGGYIATGKTNSSDIHITQTFGDYDNWIVKLDSSGYIQWEKSVGGEKYETGNCIIHTKDGGFLVAGHSTSHEYDEHTYSQGQNLWIFKLDSNGNMEWLKSLGGNYHESANSIIRASDGNYILCGYTWSTDGDISNNIGLSDIWIIKLDTAGKIIWEKTYGGSNLEYAYSIQETYDGGYILTGHTVSTDYDFELNKGQIDVFVMKLDNNGNLLWAKTLGGSSGDIAYSIIRTLDGGYILTGKTSSTDGDVSGNHGEIDMWIVKLSPDAVILQEDISDSLFAIVAPEAVCRDIDMGEVLLGKYKDSVVNDFVYNSGSWPFNVKSIYFRGNDAAAFSMVSGFPEYSLKPAAGHIGEFRFTPSRVGPHQGEIVIITQADTIIQNIYGEGVTPQLAVLEDIIDFGIVEVGDYKDTLQAVTIKNIGSAALSILDTKHNKPNDIDFTTLAGGGAFNLQPGDTCRMDLRFTPGDEGRTSGVLEFHYDGTGSPAIVQLFGEGINSDPKIVAVPDIFPDIICDNSSQSYIDISNTGGKDLIISEMNFTGTNATEFSINESLPVIVEADSTKRIMMYFNPSSPGDKNTELEIKSNADPDSLLSIELNARKDSVSIEAETNVIDLGYLCPGESKDTVLALMNNGTIETGAYIGLSTNLDAGILSFTSASGASFNFNFSFKGLSEEGIFNDTISITDSICSRTIQIPVTGLISLPEIKAGNLSISAVYGSSGEGDLLIEIISDRDIIITGLPAISAPFEFTDNPFPATLEAGQSLTLPVRYTPDDITGDSIIIILNAEPCGIAEEIQINGAPFVASATIMAADIEAYPGDKVILPITLYAEENLSISGVSSINFDLEFNPTLLLPPDYDPVKIDDTTASIKIENLQIGQNAGATLTEILFVAGLGNAEECPLTLSNPVNNNGFAEISLLPGKFKLLGICNEGGSRLLNPENQAEIINIYPNPAEDKIYIELSITEEAQTEISIFNTMGQRVSTILIEKAKTGNKTIEISTKGLGNGTYVLIFNTPTIIKSRSFSIVR